MLGTLRHVEPAVDSDLMGFQKNVLTTGEVARICNVAPRTVSKWFDLGHLRGYRIPGSKDRRIPVEHLVRFMRAYGIPLNGLDSGRKRVLILDSDRALCEAVRTALTDDAGYEVTTTDSALETGATAQEFKPHILVVDVTLPDVTPKAVTRFVRSLTSPEPVCVIGIARALGEGDGQALLQEGFDGYLSKPFEVRSLIELIEEMTAPSTVPEEG